MQPKPLIVLIAVLFVLMPGSPFGKAFAQSKPGVAPLPPKGEMAGCIRLIREKKYEEARARLEPIVKAHPGWARAHLLLALTYHEEQRYSMARPLFERALALDEREESVRPFFGWCLYYLGEGSAARQQFAAYLDEHPNYPDAHYAIGLIDYDEDRLDAALTRFQKTIEIAQASKDARTEGKARARIGDIYIRRGELEKARDELLRAVALRPDAYEAYFKLSRVYQRLGNRERATWAREQHDRIRDRLHPKASSMLRTTSQPMNDR